MNLDPPRLIRQKNREDDNVSTTDYAWLWQHVNQEKSRTFIEPISLPRHIWRDLRENVPDSLQREVIAARQRYYNRLPARQKATYHIGPPDQDQDQMRFRSVKPKKRYAKSPVSKMRYAKSPSPKKRYAKSPVSKKRYAKSPVSKMRYAKSPSPKMRYQCGK
jgi:hypothetical protein